MTVNELSQLFYLNREIEADKKRLKELELLAESPSGVNLSGIPGTPFVRGNGKVERLSAEIVDLQALIAAKQLQRIHERSRLERYIADIPDSLTRLIFELRFAQQLSWLQVAIRVGGGNTVSGVKKRCYRYIAAENAAERSRESDGA